MKTLLERRGDDRGFTLIELMVVVLIIGILLAIAIPSFFGARTVAQDQAANATLRNALTAAKVYYVQNDGSYTGFDATEAAEIEPSLPWADITFGTPADNSIHLELESQSLNMCWIDDSGTQVTISSAPCEAFVSPT